MTKRHFIALADSIRSHNDSKRAVFGKNAERMCFNVEQLTALADFCQSQNGRFDRSRWLESKEVTVSCQHLAQLLWKHDPFMRDRPCFMRSPQLNPFTWGAVPMDLGV